MDEHIHYEVVSFFHSINMLQLINDRFAADSVETRETVQNVLIEAIGTHIRNLFHFFYGKPKYNEDIIAEDFFQDVKIWRKSTVRHRNMSEIKRINKRISKEIVHLSLGGLDVKNKNWNKDWEVAYNCFKYTFIEFLRLAPQELLGARLTGEKNNFKNSGLI
ncbi:MAG: hypothetical protein CVT49_02785 [candidate division Zixibacteria bacterium HGW-Zixibacteria-1]|nr:MAG: hypothetical protein CVT49_02785 [candidate division Zixibacteria bacterium HGW-Zixibacteria-1]